MCIYLFSIVLFLKYKYFFTKCLVLTFKVVHYYRGVVQRICKLRNSDFLSRFIALTSLIKSILAIVLQLNSCLFTVHLFILTKGLIAVITIISMVLKFLYLPP